MELRGFSSSPISPSYFDPATFFESESFGHNVIDAGGWNNADGSWGSYFREVGYAGDKSTTQSAVYASSNFNFDAWQRENDSFGGNGIYVSHSHDVETHKSGGDYADIFGNWSNFGDNKIDVTDTAYIQIGGLSASVYHHVGAEVMQWDSGSPYGDYHGIATNYVDETYLSLSNGQGGGNWSQHVEVDHFTLSFGHNVGIGLPFTS